MRLFEIGGIAINALDARAMTAQELATREAANAVAMQNAFINGFNSTKQLSWLLGLQNWNPYPENPLNERFADFKIRLAAALEKRKLYRA